jgi:Mg2+/citrate symporter
MIQISQPNEPYRLNLPMKLIDIILFVLVFVSFVIGVHQSIVNGIAASYWIFMLSLMLLFLYNYRKNKMDNEEDKKNSSKRKSL